MNWWKFTYFIGCGSIIICLLIEILIYLHGIPNNSIKLILQIPLIKRIWDIYNQLEILPFKDTVYFTSREINLGLQSKNNNSDSSSATEKLILLWTKYYGAQWPFEHPNSSVYFTQCQCICVFTTNHALLQKSDAVLFEGLPSTAYAHNSSLFEYSLFPPLPRDPSLHNQLWIFVRVEPPLHHSYNMSHFDNIINWTMTYRRDSDIVWPYGSLQPIPKNDPQVGVSIEFVRNKTKLVAWMNSHCSTMSHREVLAQELSKYIPVHNYGSCPGGPSTRQYSCDLKYDYYCYRLLAAQYKFWLVFENSLCTDYLSEKIYEALRAGMVPIVYGHSQSLKALGLPPNSYINVMDFKNMGELTAYILYLDAHFEEYLKYFEWKNTHRVISYQENISNIACNLCTKLNTNHQPRSVYPSVQDWFNRNMSNVFQCQMTKLVRNDNNNSSKIQLYSVIKNDVSKE